jgi:hypothetical protein
VGIYYFHIRDGLGIVEDPDGIELPDMAALLSEVIRSATELSNDIITHQRMRLEIVDESGRIVLVTPVYESSTFWDVIAGMIIADAPVQ